MNSQNIIPQGEEKITIELTVKEAMALSGEKFNQNPQLLFNARRKIKGSVEAKLLGEDEPYGMH